MKKYISRFILWLLGWKIVGEFPQIKKYIIIVAPHTSYLDFILGQLAFFSNNKTSRLIIKKEFFKFPFKRILLSTGGLPLDRTNPVVFINQLIKIINNSDEFILTITPEGTRKKTKNWKNGFYFISEKAEIPIVIGIIDYKKKEMTIDRIFEKSGNVDEDMKKIKSYYKNANAKYPENFTCED
jgi:1-acyl-sn-glycerol-3-phosphate acyltransferase